MQDRVIVGLGLACATYLLVTVLLVVAKQELGEYMADPCEHRTLRTAVVLCFGELHDT